MGSFLEGLEGAWNNWGKKAVQDAIPLGIGHLITGLFGGNDKDKALEKIAETQRRELEHRREMDQKAEAKQSAIEAAKKAAAQKAINYLKDNKAKYDSLRDFVPDFGAQNKAQWEHLNKENKADINEREQRDLNMLNNIFNIESGGEPNPELAAKMHLEQRGQNVAQYKTDLDNAMSALGIAQNAAQNRDNNQNKMMQMIYARNNPTELEMLQKILTEEQIKGYRMGNTQKGEKVSPNENGPLG